MDNANLGEYIDYRYIKPKASNSPKIALKVKLHKDAKIMAFSFAICSCEDNFSRKIARELTSIRMDTRQILIGNYDKSKSINDNAIDIIKDVISRSINSDNGLDIKSKFFREIKRLDSSYKEIEYIKHIETLLD